MYLLGLILSYLIGSVPTAYLFGRLLKGIDIREHGSGNVGATNAVRVLGKGPGLAVFLIDVVKGIIPPAFLADALGTEEVFARIVFGVAAVCGHNWTVFLRFKGGKGIATSLGVLLGLMIHQPALGYSVAVSLLTWLIVLGVSRYVSLASICACVSLPVMMLLTSQPRVLIFLGIFFCVFVLVRHRPNIKRILSGREPKVVFPPRKKP